MKKLTKSLRLVARRDDWRPSPNSVEDARLAQWAERRQFEAETGQELDDDGKLLRPLAGLHAAS
jgi:hypothetical protein